MIPFNECIKLNNRTVEFNFRKVQAPKQDKFFISLVDSGRKTISFDMVMSQDGKWSMIMPVPESIVQLKEQLIRIIEKHCTLRPTFSLVGLNIHSSEV